MIFNCQRAFNGLKAHTQRSHKSSRPTSSATTTMERGRTSKNKVVLSPRAREIKDARLRLLVLPDIDARRVAQIRLQIENGTYRIDGSRIAEQMIEEMQLNLVGCHSFC